MAQNTLYLLYGAYELKAKYQRNLSIGTLSVSSFVGLILLTFWLISVLGKEEVRVKPQPPVIINISQLRPPPSIAHEPSQFAAPRPKRAAISVGILTPLPDEDVIDDNAVLPTRDELRDIISSPDSLGGDGDSIVIDIPGDDYEPGPDEFVPMEIEPAFIYKALPEYPRFAEMAGITGTVVVQVLVEKDGSVSKAEVAKSSGTPSLDEAAVQSAYKCKFSPGIQNGRSVKVWVKYRISFE